MDIFTITLYTLWLNPVLAFLLLKLLRKLGKWKLVVIACGTKIVIYSIFVILDVSTTDIKVDFFISSFVYFCFWTIIWNTLYFEKGLFKTLCLIALFSFLTFNYCSSTVGILAVGFTLYDWETTQELKIDDDLIYKETPLGNAISDFRGKRIDIYKQSSFFPFLEYPFQSKSFLEIPPYRNVLEVEYDEKSKTLFLTARDTLPDSIVVWTERITLK